MTQFLAGVPLWINYEVNENYSIPWGKNPIILGTQHTLTRGCSKN